MKLYVGNLSFETTENDLQDLFEQHGSVSEVKLMMDRMTGKSRGFAFLTMNDNAQATAMFLAHGAQLVGVASATDSMRRIGRAFGRLIYLLDAFEDYGKDARSADFQGWWAVRASGTQYS